MHTEKLIYGTIYAVLAQVITFFQLQGQMKYEWVKNNLWFSLLLGIPVSYLFIMSVKNFVGAFDGEIWPSRLIGFVIGVVVFTIMAEILFKEPLTLKTITCLLLAIAIILVQLFWKNSDEIQKITTE